MRIVANNAGISDPPTNEWWMWVNDGAQDEVADAITALNVPGTQVLSELRLRQSLERDPVALGLVGALILGSLAAAACAAVGLIVGAIVSTRERRTETALLRALGMSRRGVTAGVAIDNAYLLAFGLPAGMAVGILLAMLILPHTPLNRTGTAVVPTPWVVIPVEALAGLAIVGLALLLITVFAASRTANRMAIADVLRTGEN
jgi:ABC-type lipoprotein release transport system permease subunit